MYTVSPPLSQVLSTAKRDHRMQPANLILKRDAQVFVSSSHRIRVPNPRIRHVEDWLGILLSVRFQPFELVYQVNVLQNDIPPSNRLHRTECRPKESAPQKDLTGSNTNKRKPHPTAKIPKQIPTGIPKARTGLAQSSCSELGITQENLTGNEESPMFIVQCSKCDRKVECKQVRKSVAWLSKSAKASSSAHVVMELQLTLYASSTCQPGRMSVNEPIPEPLNF